MKNDAQVHSEQDNNREKEKKGDIELGESSKVLTSKQGQDEQWKKDKPKVRANPMFGMTWRKNKKTWMFLFLIVSLFAILYSSIFSHGDDNGMFSNECSASLVGLNSSTVSIALTHHCDCIPKWMEGDVYFEPLVTLFLAFLAVVILVNSNRISPILSDIAQNFVNVTSTENMISKFRCLPKHVQSNTLKSLKLAYPEMPDMIMKKEDSDELVKNSSMNGDNDALNEEELPLWLNGKFTEVKDLFKELTLDTQINDDNDSNKTDTMTKIELILNDVIKRGHIIEQQKKQQTIDSLKDVKDSENDGISLDDDDQMEDVSTESSMTMKDGEQLSFQEEEKEQGKDKVKLKKGLVKRGSLVARQSFKEQQQDEEGIDDENDHGNEKSINNDENGVKNNDSVGKMDDDEEEDDEVNPEFIEWVNGYKPAFFNEVLISEEEMCDEAEKPDITIMLFLELIVGVWVLIDYFGIQTQPSGSSWQCRWAYFSAIVMYKPFTVPMWFCLTLISHYTFVDDLYKNYKRDKRTGTPYGAPFERSKLTLFIIAMITAMQLMWFMGAMVIAIPLMLIFLPVVSLLGFVVPFIATQLPQRVIGWLKTHYRYSFLATTNMPESEVSEAGKNEEELNGTGTNDSSAVALDLIKPIHITETVFSLKASATQLVSLSMLSLLFLPFLTGDLTWTEGAKHYVDFAFDLPQLVLQFKYTFKWPDFEQPRLAFQLALGVLIAVLQFVFRTCKRFLLSNRSYFLIKTPQIPHPHLDMNKKNNFKMLSKPNMKKTEKIENDDEFWVAFENILYRVFTFVSWGFFQFLMVISYAAFEAASIKIYDLIVFGVNGFILMILKVLFMDRANSVSIKFLWYIVILFILMYNILFVFMLMTLKVTTATISDYMVLGICAMICPVTWFVFLFLENFIQFAKTQRIIKYFGKGTFNEDILEFSQSEDSMYYTHIELLLKSNISEDIIPIVEHRCPWIDIDTQSRIDGAFLELTQAILLNNLKEMSEILLLGIDVNDRGCYEDEMKQLIDEAAKLTDEEFESVDKRDLDVSLFVSLFAQYFNSFGNQSAADIGSTPLMIAAGRDGLNTVNLLVHAGADIEAKNQYGRTPLMIAARRGSMNSLKQLLEAGANIEAVNERSGDTVLMNSLRCHSWTSQVLIDAGANIETKNKVTVICIFLF
mmetsp:Transcript_17479/g.20592  ORF Transcript_17479/g.20592 Transcript_17479/m.20592 type:complete len:1167 (-) Transcript_17479:547-4047(-)